MKLNRFIAVASAVAMSVAGAPACLSQAKLEYQQRDNRFEGIKPKPVSGYDIELLSARADYSESPITNPSRLKIRFYLANPANVFVTVRELDYRYYYWLDKVQPAKPWSLGFANIFEWPTADVIAQLDGLGIYDLGVVARLEKPEPSKLERVAPVIFYASGAPAKIPGYLFAFKTSNDARVVASVFPEGSNDAVFRQVFPRKAGGIPFVVKWDASQAPAGQYRLVLTGWFLSNNEPIDQTVLFSHQPQVQ